DGPLDDGESSRTVVKPDVLGSVADVRRVDLERDPEGQMAAARDVPQREDELPVVRSFTDRLRRETVDGVGLGPARVEDQDRVLDLVSSIDAEARRIDKPAAYALRRVHVQARRCGPGRGSVGPLPEGLH